VHFFEDLVAATAGERTQFASVPQLQDGLSGRISRATYLAYLTEAYHHVRHTVPLMQAARARMDASRERFRDALGDYMAEEAGHEGWILDDIRHAGGDWRAARDSAPRGATRAMIDYAYAYVESVHPMGLFGMIYVLESVSTQLATRGAAAVADSLGLGPECFTYLTSHGSLDLEHMAFFQQLMGEVAEPADRSAIIAMANAMFRLFADVFRSIPHDRNADHAI